MHAEEFYQRRKPDWDKLNALIKESRVNISRLSPAQVETMASLYRSATADLALAQRDFPQHPVTRYLNQLIGQAHAVIYQEEPMALKRLWRFVSVGFPRLFRELFPFILAAFLMFAVPAILTGASTAIAPESSAIILPASVQELIPEIQQQQLWTNIPVEERPYTSSFIMQNNIKVAILAFGSGITGGLLTLLVLVENGVLFGGLMGLTAHYGVGFELATFVIGHGVIELSVIFMAGGSGLLLGWSLLRPGFLRRRDALAQAAKKAVRLLMGAVPLLIVAGAIEAFVSPNEQIGWPVKWGIGIGTGVALYLFLFLAGRERKATEFIEAEER